MQDDSSHLDSRLLAPSINVASEKITRNLWIAAVLVALQTFMFGYIFSCMNSCITTGDNNKGSECFDRTDPSCPKGTVYNDLNLSEIEAQLTTSLTVLGAWFGSLYGNQPAELYGRRKTLLGNCFVFIVGTAISASGNFYLLFIGRFIVGVGVGIASAVAPVLLAEIAAPSNRGTITTLTQVAITVAIFIAAVVAYGFVTTTSHGWQYVLGLGALPAVVFLVAAPYVPESPKWLVTQNRIDEARSLLLYLRSSSSKTEVDQELSGILSEASEGGDSSGSSVTWQQVFTYKRGVIIGCGLMFFQAMTGVNTVVFYSTSIFAFAGFENSLLATILVTLTNFFTTIACVNLVDRLGRKTLLRISGWIMLLALVVLSVVLISTGSSAGGKVAVAMVLLFIIGFAVGLGAVTWVVISEVMPTKLRAKGSSLFLSINWGMNFLIGFLTLTAINGLGNVNLSADDDSVVKDAQRKGVAILYFIFAGFTVAYIAFLELHVPETKGMVPSDFLGKSASESPAKMPLLTIQDP